MSLRHCLSETIGLSASPIGREKRGLYLHAPGLWEIYPAVNALSLIGEAALPKMLDVIKYDTPVRHQAGERSLCMDAGP